MRSEPEQRLEPELEVLTRCSERQGSAEPSVLQAVQPAEQLEQHRHECALELPGEKIRSGLTEHQTDQRPRLLGQLLAEPEHRTRHPEPMPAEQEPVKSPLPSSQ